MNFLLDKNFLIDLDNYPHKEIYAKLISLDLNECPTEQIEGKITQGNINIDGSSSVRRTVNLTLVAKDLNITDYYWGLNTRFKLEIGIRNYINKNYPEICWFKQGIFIITSFNSNQVSNSFNITITGKDKMGLLNGELGGLLHSSVDFGVMDIEENGVIKHKKIKLNQIIRDAVHQYGGEPFHNIIIEDLDDYALELLEYNTDNPAYAFKKEGADEWINITLNDEMIVYEIIDNNFIPKKLKSLTDDDLINLNKINFEDKKKNFYLMKNKDNAYQIAKINYGETIGYRKTELTYAGDLILNAGEAVTTMLDKIVAMLSDFEYFYNIDGQFIFRQKKINVESFWEELSGEKKETLNLTSVSEVSDYSFTNGLLVSSYTNTPDFNNLKNDFTVWGKRKSVNGDSEIPIHIRYAIDKKPTLYKALRNKNIETQKKLNIDLSLQKEQINFSLTNKVTGFFYENIPVGSEIEYVVNDEDTEIYVVSDTSGMIELDQTEQNNFITNIFFNNIDSGVILIDYYEVEEIDNIFDSSVCDWREIIYQMALDYRLFNTTPDYERKLAINNPQYPYGKTGYEQYYIDMEGFWRQLYSDIKYEQVEVTEETFRKNKYYIKILENYELATLFDNEAIYYEKTENYHWDENVFKHPETINFWIDFLDTDGQLSKFNIKAIGDRPKVVNDNNIKAIYYKETPNLIFYIGEEVKPENQDGYGYIHIGNDQLYLFSISAQGKSGTDRIDELMYQYGYCSEAVNFSCIPIYYLEPNTRISLYNNDNNINGQYILQRMTIPLTHNGLMQVTAVKVPPQLY